MKNLKTKIAILAISFVSFVGIQSVSALEGVSIGVGYNYSGFYGVGKETATSSGNGVKTVTEEAGAFDDTVASVFLEYAASDVVSLGLEYIMEDIETPENVNVQGTTAGEGSPVNNKVKADFEDHVTLYANINMPFNTYLKLGYVMVDVATKETLGTGGAYGNVDTTGYTAGLGLNINLDNGIFVRTELSATSYDDVSTTNTNEADKKVSVTDMMSATAGIKIGKTF